MRPSPQKNLNAFTLIELMVAVAAISILAATSVGAYSTYVARSKTAEAAQLLAKIAHGEVSYYATNDSFLEAGPTNIPPSGLKTSVDFTTDSRWVQIGFDVRDPIYYGYQTVLTATNAIECQAVGDLDSDGDTSLFQITVQVVDSSAPQVSGIMSFDELE